MVDTEQQKGNPSSIASAPVPEEKQFKAASDNPVWARCMLPDPSKKYSLKCNYCKCTFTGGITRIKYHLAGIKGYNAKKCKNVPTPVKEEMQALLTKKTNEKEQKNMEKERERGGIDIDNSDGENSSEEGSDQINEVLVLNPKASKGCTTSRSAACDSSIDRFYKPTSVEESVKMMKKGVSISGKVQTTLTTQKREERRDRACEYICHILHNTVTLPSFSHMLEAIGQFGRGLRGPSPYEMSGPFLQKRKQKVLDGFKNHKESWELTGCTVMTDAWTDRRGRGVMNLVVHSAHGACFIDSVECSGERKDGKYVQNPSIEQVGEDNVVQVVIDNASVNISASSYMRAKRPKIFWNGCAAHCIDLMLEDIGKLPILLCFVSSYYGFGLMRKILGRDLVRSGVTRFATAYLNLKSLQDHKKELAKLFGTDELNEWDYLKKAKGKKALTVVRSESFWKNVDMAPLANVLRRMDSDIPAMGFFHGLMLNAKKEISERFDNDESRFKVAWDIVDKRWDNELKTPLHLAGYYLNPYFYYPKKSEIEKDGSFREGVIACITRMVEDEATQDDIIEELNMYQDQQGSFGQDIAVRQRRNKNFNPAKWWLNYGTSTPKLRILASRILNLTCSSSACEKNWSVFEQVHTKRRNRLLHDRMRDLVFVKFNSKLRIKNNENKSKDPIEKKVQDVLDDDDNEFITGLAPVPNAIDEQQAQDGASQEGESPTASTMKQGKKNKASQLQKYERPIKEQRAHSSGDAVWQLAAPALIGVLLAHLSVPCWDSTTTDDFPAGYCRPAWYCTQLKDRAGHLMS
ncbi:hypothetical protein U9M48_014231 [Paspalum notatum var. saurae]|uniref:BED-type domain-containing protein n=1 Tax=Paspalum notatum var. saurae TaxID=547442 RepID=A0AAQ3T1L3_PASNO